MNKNAESMRRAAVAQGCFHLAMACMIATGLVSGPAAADQSDTLNVVMGTSITHDTNILRQPASANPQGDTVKVVNAGLRLDKSYSLQQFQIDYTDTRSRFANLRQQNSDTIDYRGAWLWHLTPRIKGTLEADQKQALVEADESSGTARNLRTTTNRNFTIDGLVFGGWHLLLGTNQSKQSSESQVLTSADFLSINRQLGARYDATSGSSISVIQNSRNGEYLNRVIDPVNFLDNRYYETESELKFVWKLSGRSTLNGRLAWLARHHEHFARLDYSGPVGGLDYNWTATGRLRLDASAKRTISPNSSLFSTHRVENLLSITPKLELSKKTTLQLRLDYSITEFRDPIVAAPGPLRRDVRRNVNLSANWDISRAASLSANLQRQRRSSNDPNFGYKTAVMVVNLKLTF
jgi:exopolysaccharide biosynthesis operon protein EpsL